MPGVARGLLALLALGGVVGLFWAVSPPMMQAGPGDRALGGLPLSGPLRLVVFGTSLSAPPQTWPDDLATALSRCRHAPVSVERVAKPGMGSAWALTQVARVVEHAPDLVLIEFAINDADLRDGVTLARGRANHLAILSQLHSALPDARIALMTMSPAQGPRGWLRPWLGAHYGQYAEIAAEADVGLIDLYPRWMALPADDRGLARDGLHPDPAVASGMVTPHALAALCRS